MNAINGKIRWTPHPHMAMDALTKKKGGNVEALYDLLDTGEFQIVEEAQALKDKKEFLGSCDLYSASSSWKNS